MEWLRNPNSQRLSLEEHESVNRCFVEFIWTGSAGRKNTECYMYLTVMYTLSYKCEFTRILKVGLMQLLLQISNKLNKIGNWTLF